MKKENSLTALRNLVETALLIAIAFALGRVKLFTMPNGGSVTPAAMLPLIIIGLRRGPKWGFLGCIVYGILDFMLDGGFALNLWSILLDYLLAYGALGVSGFFKGKKNGVWIAMPVAVAARFVFVFLSGVTVWADYTASSFGDIWLFSLTYQASYLLPELALMYVIAFAMRMAWPRLLNPDDVR